MANEVIIRVTARDDTAGVRDIIRQGFGVTGRQAGEEFGKGLGDGAKVPAKKSGEDTTDEAAKAAKAKAKQAGSDTGSLMGAGLLAAAPLAGAAAGAALVGGLGLGLVGLAGVVAASDDKVKAQAQAFGAELKTAGQEWGREIEQPVTEALAVMRVGFQDLKPQIGTALANVSPDIVLLGRSVTDLATQAMPGLTAASGRLIPVFSGIDGAARTVGQATGQMADDVSQHSTTIGTSISQVGQVVASLETTVGHLVGDMSDVFAHQVGGQLVTTLNTFGDLVSGVAHTALPAFGGGLQADLMVINGFMGALGPASSLLGVFGGTAMSAYMNVSLLGKLQGPIGNAATALENAGTKGTVFGDATSKAGTMLGKLGDKLPYIGIGLSLIGTAMDLDAQHATDLADKSDQMASALESGGAKAAQTRTQMDAMRKANDDYVKSVKELNASQTEGNHVAGVYGNMAGSNARQVADLSQKVQDNKQVVDDTLKKYNDWAAGMGLTAITADQLAGKVAIYSNTSQSASSNTSQLKADIDILNTAASTADQKIKALSDSLAIMGDHGMQKAEDYTSQFNTALDGFKTQMENAKGSVFDMNGSLDLTSERGRDVLQVLEQSQQSWAGQAQAMADAGQTQDQINESLNTNRDRLIAVLNTIPGLKGHVEDLLATYGLIPKDISTKVNATTAAAQGVIDSFIRMNNGRTIDIYTSVLGSGGIASAGRLAHGGVMGAAASGKVLGGGFDAAANGRVLAGAGLTVVGEQGAELIRNAVGATVVPRSGVDKAITDAMEGSGRGPAPSGLQLTFAGSVDSAFATAFMNLCRSGQITLLPQFIQK